MHPDMRGLWYIARLARQQQEHAHRLAIGFGLDARVIALRGMGPDADADGGQRTEAAPAPSERNGVVDRTAAGIQHDGGATELASARELIEILGAIGGDNADGRDPAVAIRQARDPAEFHRQLAFFESHPGMRRAAERRDRAGQCDAQGGGAEQRPTAEIKRRHKPQFGPFPASPETTSL
jgi:hypothetical protein